MTLYGEYRPAFVTQRDGSALANSNCRMASIAMGVDYQTLGGDTSTGAKMRSYQDDQSGGTDSGDAKQAWDRGYDQSLRVMDGSTWSDALADLKAGRAVHLDVWHAAVGGPCLSGSGGYGHTMFVLPDVNDSGWAVGDPWCTDGYHRVAESKLKAGAENWGNQVYGRALQEPDYPTGGPDPRDPRVLRIVARIVRLLMTQYHPGNPYDGPPPADTGGGGAILYTTTKVQEGDDDMAGLDELRGGMGAIVQRPGQDYMDVPAGRVLGQLGENGVYHVRAVWYDANGKKWYLVDGGGDAVMRWIKA